jgi:hypothetical protein
MSLHRNGTTSENTIPTPQRTEVGQTNLGTDQPSFSQSECRPSSQRSGVTTETTWTFIHKHSCGQQWQWTMSNSNNNNNNNNNNKYVLVF